MSLSKLAEIVKDKESQHAAIHGVAKSQTQLSELNNLDIKTRQKYYRNYSTISLRKMDTKTSKTYQIKFSNM